MDWKWAASFEQLSLNCLMMFEIFSNLARLRDVHPPPVPVDVPVLVSLSVRDDQEGGLLEQQHLQHRGLTNERPGN